jgi:hypothetical protein
MAVPSMDPLMADLLEVGNVVMSAFSLAITPGSGRLSHSDVIPAGKTDDLRRNMNLFKRID